MLARRHHGTKVGAAPIRERFISRQFASFRVNLRQFAPAKGFQYLKLSGGRDQTPVNRHVCFDHEPSERAHADAHFLSKFFFVQREGLFRVIGVGLHVRLWFGDEKSGVD